MIITDLAVFQRPDHDSPFRLIELAPGVTARGSAREDDGELRRSKARLPLIRVKVIQAVLTALTGDPG